MNAKQWLARNAGKLDKRTPWELRFVEEVMAKVPGLDFTYVQAQTPFREPSGKNRRIDFTIRESEHVRVAIEVDGYDKRGDGPMDPEDFRDWSLKEQALAAAGWRVFRVANSLITRKPKECVRNLELLLEQARAAARDATLPDAQRDELDRLEKDRKQDLERIESQLARIEEHAAGGGFQSEPKASRMTPVVAGLLLLVSVVVGLGVLFLTKDDKEAASATAGNCGSPNWKSIDVRPGETARVVGPVVGARYLKRIAGSPTFMDVGARFPDRDRVVLVVWGRNRRYFDPPPEVRYEGVTVSVTGRVETFRGVRQVEVRSPTSIRVCA